MANHQTNINNGGFSTEEANIAVVMVPLPAQGHLNQLLELSQLIAAYNLPVNFVSTTTHCRQAKLRAHGCDALTSTNINFIEFPTPSFENSLPEPNASNKFPSQLLPSFNASLQLREPFRAYFENLSRTTKRVIVIYDFLMSWVVQDVPSMSNAEAYCFHSCSAFTMYSVIWEATPKPIPAEAEIVLKDLPSMESFHTPGILQFIAKQQASRINCAGNIHNTCREIEGLYLDLLNKEYGNADLRQWAIGPFNAVDVYVPNGASTRHKCLEWLDKQAPGSVLFVSFGSTTSFSAEQIRELAIGLEQSQQKFIWVVRDADKGDVFTGEVRRIELPERYEERLQERGFIVRDWAPQLEILAHPSTGGFMSHCGWNSCMESITMGVPIAAWPMHSDQPRNAVLIAKVLKIGVMVREWKPRDELVTATTVENGVKKLMASEEGDGIRKKATEVGNGVRKSVKDGATRMEMDSFVSHITR